MENSIELENETIKDLHHDVLGDIAATTSKAFGFMANAFDNAVAKLNKQIRGIDTAHITKVCVDAKNDIVSNVRHSEVCSTACSGVFSNLQNAIKSMFFGTPLGVTVAQLVNGEITEEDPQLREYYMSLGMDIVKFTREASAAKNSENLVIIKTSNYRFSQVRHSNDDRQQ